MLFFSLKSQCHSRTYTDSEKWLCRSLLWMLEEFEKALTGRQPELLFTPRSQASAKSTFHLNLKPEWVAFMGSLQHDCEFFLSQNKEPRASSPLECSKVTKTLRAWSYSSRHRCYTRYFSLHRLAPSHLLLTYVLFLQVSYRLLWNENK